MSIKITSEVDEISLANAVSFIVDNRGKTVPTAEDETGIELIATNCISNEHLYPLKLNVRYVSEEIFENWFRAHPKPGDIIITNKGSNNGEVCLVPDPVDFCIAQDMVALRADSEKIYPYYLFASLRSSLVQRRIKYLNVDAVIPHFKKTDFDKLLIPLPSEEVQRFIGDFYMVFSRKIENLRRQNETLERIAQTLFKHWFIDFEFPNDDGKPYKSSGGEMVRSELGEIPIGWRIGKLGDFCTIFRGSSPRPITSPVFFENGTIPWIKIADATKSRSIYLSETKEFCTEAALPHTRLLKKGNLILSNSATVGIPMILNLDGCIHDGWLSFKEYKIITRNFLFFVLVSKLKFLTQYADGTVQKNLNTGILKNMDFVVPPEQLIKEFTAISQSMFDKILVNEQQIQTLTRTRDVLLPQLMSGKLRITES